MKGKGRGGAYCDLLGMLRRISGNIACPLRHRLSRSAIGSQAVTCHPYSDAKAATEEEPVVGPGGSSTNIPSMYEQSAGLERLEYLAGLAGRPIFLMDQLKVEAFGTMAKPIPVPSLEGSRIVGCSGFPVDSHETMWFKVEARRGEPSRCPECGQAFAIKFVNEALTHEHSH